MSRFKYLKSIITLDNDLKLEVNPRIQMRNRCNYSLESIFGSKIQWNMTLIRSVVFISETRFQNVRGAKL